MRNGQYKKRGAAAMGDGYFKKRGRCRHENRSIKEVGALPQREMGSVKSGADRKSTRLNSSNMSESRMPSSA